MAQILYVHVQCSVFSHIKKKRGIVHFLNVVRSNVQYKMRVGISFFLSLQSIASYMKFKKKIPLRFEWKLVLTGKYLYLQFLETIKTNRM